MTLLPRPSGANQRRITQAMRLVLAAMVGYGLLTGNPKAVMNGSVALVITFVPAVLERNYDLSLDPWLALWLTTAVLLHSLGSSGLYSHIEWWDHVTHALSASLIAGVGYTTVRAIDLHHRDIIIPREVAFVYIFVVVLSFGVVWELLEFAIGVTAGALGMPSVLTQYGVYDTLWDIIYNSIGGLLVALWGGVYLTDLSTALSQRFAERRS